MAGSVWPSHDAVLSDLLYPAPVLRLTLDAASVGSQCRTLTNVQWRFVVVVLINP
jgi:hypothetical protein